MHLEFISTLYIIGAIVAIAACVPQVMQLIRMRTSDEFQLTTWVVWLITQSISLTYMISIGNALLIATSTAWVAFYLLMVSLIIRYRSNTILRVKLARVGALLTLSGKA